MSARLIRFAALLIVAGSATAAQAALVAHWAFDNNLLDSSPNGNHLALSTGTVVYGAAAPGVGGAASFNFNGATMLVDTTPVNFGFTGPWTFAAWVNAPAPGSNYHGYFWRGVPGGGDIEIYGQAGTNDLYAIHNRSNAGTMDYMGFPDQPVSVYHHMAVVFDGSIWRTYYNGVLQSVNDPGPGGTAALVATAGHQISVGKLNHLLFNPNFLNGLLDEAFVYNQALTAGEIANLIAFNDIVEPQIIPEPSTIVLLGLGATCLAWRRRTRRSA